MANRFLFLVFFFFTMTKALTQGITRQNADSMLLDLKKNKPGIERLDLLLSVAQFHIFKPGEQQVDFDSATVYINEASALNKTLKSSMGYGYQLLTESYLLKEKGNKVESKKMVENATSILKTGNNKDYLGRAYYELSTYYSYEDSLELSQRIALVKLSIDAFQQTKNLKARANSLEMLGDLYQQTSEYPEAMQVLKQAVAVYDSIGHQEMQGVYVLFGKTYLYQRNHGQALFYFLKALKTAQIVHDSSMQLCQINNYLGSLYREIDRRDIAISYWKEAMKTAKKYNENSSIYVLARNIATTYNELGWSDQAAKMLALMPEPYFDSEYARIHFYIVSLRTFSGLKQYSKAKPYCDSLLRLVNNSTVSDKTRHQIHRVIASYFIRTEQYARARFFLMKNIPIEKRMPLLETVILGYQLWYKLDSTQGNFQSAFNYLHLYKTKTDSTFSENKLRQLQVLGIEYEVGMKEDSIKLKDQNIALLTQRNSLQQATLKQAAFVKKVTIAGIILAFVIIVLLYRQYQLKQKSNNAITYKNEQLQHFLTEKEWLLKEIHHRVKNNLQIVMSLLNSQSVYINNDAALTAIHDSQHRVHAMSLIHQKLYNSENLSSIDMSIYIHELVSYLADSFTTGLRVRFEYDIEPLEMDVSQAVPLGLILNEAITNSIKYAFPNDREGVIKITLSNIADTQYVLQIADNGIGISSHLKNKKTGSLGMSLIAGLSEDLDGSFSIENNNGTVIRILFVHHMSVKRPGPLVSSFATSN